MTTKLPEHEVQSVERSRAINFLQHKASKPSSPSDYKTMAEVLQHIQREFIFSSEAAAALAYQFFRFPGWNDPGIFRKLAEDPSYRPAARPTGETGKENDSSIAHTMIGRCKSYMAGFDWGFAFAYHDKDLLKCPPVDSEHIGFSISQYENGAKEGIVQGRLSRKAEGK